MQTNNFYNKTIENQFYSNEITFYEKNILIKGITNNKKSKPFGFIKKLTKQK